MAFPFGRRKPQNDDRRPAAEKPPAWIDGGSGSVERDDADLELEPQPARPAAPAPKHDAELLTLAREYGISEAEAGEYSPAQLVKQISRLQARDAAVMADRAARPASPPPPPPADEIDWGEGEVYDEETGRMVKKKFTEEDIHPAVRQLIKSHAKQLREVMGDAKAAREELASQQAASLGDAINDGFDSLGPTYEAVFGKGPMAGLPDGPERQRRNLVWTQVREKLAGQPRPTAKQLSLLVNQTATAIFGQLLGGVMPPRGQPKPQPLNDGGYEGAGHPTRPVTPRNPANGRFASQEDIADEDFARRYMDAGSEQPTARRGGDRPPSREAAIDAVDEQIRSWDQEESANGVHEDSSNGPFVP